MLIARTRQELDSALSTLRLPGGSSALVPTMGALHEGHLSLLAEARRLCACVVTSIFVNPTQFGPSEDLARYPRDEAGDLDKLRNAGCDVVWLPAVTEMYPDGDATFVDVSGPALGWEGDARPGHFRGVATVVAKLLGQVKPDVACFGEKDWQQVQVIARMTRDLSLGVRVVTVPTMREADGLALSSRNRFLTPEQRAAAPGLYRVLHRAAAELQAGAGTAGCLDAARLELSCAGFVVDYLALVDGASLLPLEKLQSGARLIAAARVGTIRLLDNIDAGDASGG